MKRFKLFAILVAFSLCSFATGLADLMTEAQFNGMFPHKNFYATDTKYGFPSNPTNRELFTYANLLAAANSFPKFLTEGTDVQKKQELAAFLGETSHETGGGWGTDYAPGAERYNWGYCFPRELEIEAIKNNYTGANATYPPVSGQYYYGRGPIQISWNTNYGQFSQEVLADKNILLNNPEKVLENGTIFWQTAIWFWMKPQGLKPSCHAVMTGQWDAEIAMTLKKRVYNGLLPGFGLTIDIINGGLEAGNVDALHRDKVKDRIGYYQTFCNALGVAFGDNLDCLNMVRFDMLQEPPVGSGYLIKGKIVDASNNPIANITINLKNGSSVVNTTTSDASGDYSLDADNGTYTLELIKLNYSFSPISTINISGSDVTLNNITATYSGSYYSISGNIKKDDGTTNFDGVSVALTGGKIATTTTDASGNYSFTNLEQNLDYTITPTKSGSVFTTKTFTNLTANQTANFTAQKATVVSGSITLNGTALSGVKINVSNTADSTFTNASGNFVTPTMTNGKNYMITPIKDGYIFDPAYKYYSSISQAETFNFTAKAVSGAPKKRIVYYYPNWGIYGRKFFVHNIETKYLTNILFAFIMPFYVDGTKKIDDPIPFRSGKNGLVISVENITVNGVAKSVGLAITDDNSDVNQFGTGWLDYDSPTKNGGTYTGNCQTWLDLPYKVKGVLGQMVQLRKKAKIEQNRDIQIQISIGGWTLAQALPLIATNQDASDAFGRACKTFLDKSTYDGVDIDWEFPVSGGTDGTETIDGALVPAQPHSVDDPINFTRLMKSIRTAIGKDKLLTMASSQNPKNILNQYVFPGTMSKFNATDNIMDYLDYMQTMTYDYGGYWCGVATHECPLYNSNNPSDENKGMSASLLIDTLLSKNGGNVSPSKIVMGQPFYGKIFAGIEDGGTHGLYQTHPKTKRLFGSWDPTNVVESEASTSIDYGDLKQGKALAGSEHNYLNKPSSGFVEYWDDVVKCPYLYNPTSKIFISYDDANSITEKIKFLNNRYLLGAMVWEVTQDTKDGELMKVLYNNIQQAKLKIEGTIVDNTGAGISGVTVALSGYSTQNVTTGSDGKFIFIGLESNQNYNVAISKSPMVFLDASYSFNSLSESKSVNIIGSNSSYAISGKTTLADGTTLLANSNVSLYKGADLIKTIASTDGNYSFSNVPGGFSYTIKATNNGYACSSGDISLSSLSSNKTDQNFKFAMQQFKISGYVKTSDNAVSGVMVSLSGSKTATLTTDANGYFETVMLDAIGNYVVTPIRENAVVTPIKCSFTNLLQNETCNFSFTEETKIYGYIEDGNTPLVGVPVRISTTITPWMAHNWSDWGFCGTTTDANGYYEFRNGPTGANIALSITATRTWGAWPGVTKNFKPLGDTAWTVFSGSHRLDWNTNPTATEINNNSSDLSIKIIPNPFLESFLVKLNGVFCNNIKVTIYNISGQIIYSEILKAENDEIVLGSRNNISLSGSYILELQCGDRKYTKKILKK